MTVSKEAKKTEHSSTVNHSPKALHGTTGVRSPNVDNSYDKNP